MAWSRSQKPCETVRSILAKTPSLDVTNPVLDTKKESLHIDSYCVIPNTHTGLVTSILDVFASIDRTVSQGFWLRDHVIFTSIYLNLRVVASISRSLQSRLNKRGSVALVSQIELNKREADSQYDTHV